jgi:xylulokinase
MPDIVAPGRVVGHVTPAAAAATGLPRGTPVIGGATDSLATFLGHGAVRRDDTIIYYGSTWTVMVATCDLTKVLVEPSLIDDYVPWRLAAYGLNAGRFLENLRIAAFGGQTSEALDAAAAAVPAGARGVAVIPLPTSRFHGGQVSPSRGAIVGLGLAHTQADVWRAGLESLGYLVADGLDGGPPPTGRVVAAGGGARSATWRGVVSAITGLSQHYHPRGSAALGAALLAARGLGAVESLDAVAEGWLPDAETTCTRSEGAEVAAYCQERRAWRLYAEAVSQLDERREGLLTGGATT